VSVRDFEFALHISDNDPDDIMLRDVVRSVLDRIGFGASAAAELMDLMRADRAREPQSVSCLMRFRAHGGELHIAMVTGGREWKTSRPLPR